MEPQRCSSRSGVLTAPTVGGFKDGRGEFYDKETWDGKPILVRFVITPRGPDSIHFEQAFSPDDGRTWELNWITDDTRVKSQPRCARTRSADEHRATQTRPAH